MGQNIIIYRLKAYDSVIREVLYNIFIEYGIHMKLVKLIKMCLNVSSKVHTGKNLSDLIPTQNGPKQGAVLSPLLSNFSLECAISKVQEDWEGL
jgi:hypothetical protein